MIDENSVLGVILARGGSNGSFLSKCTKIGQKAAS
jgi:hypothetical protein